MLYLFISGSTVRQRVVVVLKGKYKTVDEAEDDLGITVGSYLGLDAANQTVDHQPAHVPSHLLSSIEHLGESQLKLVISKAFGKIADQKSLLIELATKSPVAKLLGSVTEEFYRHLPDVKKDILLNSLFLQRATDHGIDSNPGDFATVSLRAMLTLQQNAKPNLVYKWSRCLHNEEEKSSLDFERMPFGLIQYCMEFFSCTHVSQVCLLFFCYTHSLYVHVYVWEYGCYLEIFEGSGITATKLHGSMDIFLNYNQ